MGSQCPSTLWEGGGSKFPFLLSLTPTQDKNKGQMLSVVYSTYYKQLKFRKKKKKKIRPETTGGCSDWLPDQSKALPGGAASRRVGGDRCGVRWRPGPLGAPHGDRLAPQQDDSGGMTWTRHLHRRGHAVNGVVDLVFVGIQSFSSIPVVP